MVKGLIAVFVFTFVYAIAVNVIAPRASIGLTVVGGACIGWIGAELYNWKRND